MERNQKNYNSFLKKNKVEGLALPDAKAYYITIVIRMGWYWWMDRHRNQWSQAETDSHAYSQLIFGKGIIVIQWSKDRLFNRLC